MRPRIDWLTELLGEPLDPHTDYIVIGASAMVFDVEFECRRAFAIDPTTDEFIRMHAARIVDMTFSPDKKCP
jgi:hypothetical protein